MAGIWCDKPNTREHDFNCVVGVFNQIRTTCQISVNADDFYLIDGYLGKRLVCDGLREQRPMDPCGYSSCRYGICGIYYLGILGGSFKISSGRKG